MNDILRDTAPAEPVSILTNAEGEHVAVSASVADGVRWSMRKFRWMQSGLSSEDAERQIQEEMKAESV